jgi:uncharacterized membrane protein
MKHNDKLATKFFEHGVRMTAGVTIQRSASDLYAVWRNFKDLPRFIDDLQSVTMADPHRTHWSVKGPGGRIYEWDARIINDEPNRRIVWRTDDRTSVPNAGSVTFHELPFHRGTEVKAVVEYLPPAGSTGDSIAKLLGADPATLLRRAMFRFRQLMESGEVATAHGQPAGANSRRSDRPGESPRKTDSDLNDIAQVEERS